MDTGLHLYSRFLHVNLDPTRGANIHQIESNAGGRDSWLFCDPSRASSSSPDRYDDVWIGGFEELFPNDAAGEFDGRNLPDHGELWNAAFDVVERSDSMAWLRRECKAVPAVVDKRIEADPEAPRFTVHYRIQNTGDERLWFLFKLHPAVRIEPGDEILLPGGAVAPVDAGFSRMLAGPGTWPRGPRLGGGTIDLSVVPERGELKEFVYVSDMPDGWCGLRRSRTGQSIIFKYPRDVLPYCWIFMTYGGWRDYYTVVLEPCTNIPKDLGEARRRQSCAFLDPKYVLELTVSVEVQGVHGR